MRCMRVVRFVLCSVLATTGVARADLLTRTLDGALPAAQPAAGAPSTTDDLLAWAGPARLTSLPELLEIAVRQAPALQGAQIDIAIAQAQIEQTWARHDWQLGGQVSGSWSEAGLLSGVAVSDTKRFSIGAQLSRGLSTGGRIGVAASTAYFKTESS